MTMIIDGTNGGFFPSWTTATRPASPSVGQMGYNTTIGLFDQYTASGWVSSLTGASQSIPKSALPTGSVLQVVGATYNTTVSTSGTSLVTTGLTATITPTSSTSKIYVMLVNPMRRNAAIGATYGMQVAIFRNGSNIVTAMSNMGYSDPVGNMAESWLIPYNYLDSPATTSATTYTMYFGMTTTGLSGSSCVDGNTATLTLMEIAA